MKFFSQLGCKPLEAWDLSYASLASFTGQPHTLFKMFRQENKQAHQPHRDHLVELQIKNLTPREKQPSPRPPQLSHSPGSLLHASRGLVDLTDWRIPPQQFFTTVSEP